MTQNLRSLALTFLVLAASQVFAGTLVKCAVLTASLAKTTFNNLDDLDDTGCPECSPITLFETDSAERRRVALAHFPLGMLVAAPGHRIVRNPQWINLLVPLFAAGLPASPNETNLFLNAITDDFGNVLEVDIWDGHHRLIAYYQAGFETVGQLPESKLTLLVNGRAADGKLVAHNLPVSGFERNQLDKFEKLPESNGVPGDVPLHGKYSNHELGSRATLKKIAELQARGQAPRIGVWLLPEDGLTPAVLARVRAMKVAYASQFDEILLVAGESNRRHFSEWTSQLADEDGINLFVGDLGLRLDYGDSLFLSRVKQIYATPEVYLLASEAN